MRLLTTPKKITAQPDSELTRLFNEAVGHQGTFFPGQEVPATRTGEKGEGDMLGTTSLNAPQSDGPARASSADSFARFCHVAATNPEKLSNIPALAKELGIGESTAYRYRQRFAQLGAEAETGRSGPRDGTSTPPEPLAAAQPTQTDQGQLTPAEVDQEIANILLMAKRIRGFRRTSKDVTDAYIAERLGIEVADVEKTLRFEKGYLEIERRLKQRKT